MKSHIHSVPDPADKPRSDAETTAGRQADEAILSALSYADIFRFPLSVEEIVRFAPETTITIDEAQARLNTSEPLQALVKEKSGFYFLEGRDEGNVQKRLDREAESKQQLKVALRRLIPLQGIPFLRAAAVTGALAAFNSPVGDDIDLLIISARNRTWITYFCLRLWRRFGHNPDICFNVFLTEGDLVFRNQNMFYAREILGALPIFNTGAFERFIEANLWIYNIYPSYTPDPERLGFRLPQSPSWRRRQHLAEKLMAGPFGDIIEYAVRKVQSKRLIKSSPGASLSMRRNRIKLHKQDNRHPILDKYDQRVGEWVRRYEELAGEPPLKKVEN